MCFFSLLSILSQFSRLKVTLPVRVIAVSTFITFFSLKLLLENLDKNIVIEVSSSSVAIPFPAPLCRYTCELRDIPELHWISFHAAKETDWTVHCQERDWIFAEYFVRKCS